MAGNWGTQRLRSIQRPLEVTEAWTEKKKNFKVTCNLEVLQVRISEEHELLPTGLLQEWLQSEKWVQMAVSLEGVPAVRAQQEMEDTVTRILKRIWLTGFSQGLAIAGSSYLPSPERTWRRHQGCWSLTALVGALTGGGLLHDWGPHRTGACRRGWSHRRGCLQEGGSHRRGWYHRREFPQRGACRRGHAQKGGSHRSGQPCPHRTAALCKEGAGEEIPPTSFSSHPLISYLYLPGTNPTGSQRAEEPAM